MTSGWMGDMLEGYYTDTCAETFKLAPIEVPASFFLSSSFSEAITFLQERRTIVIKKFA